MDSAVSNSSFDDHDIARWTRPSTKTASRRLLGHVRPVHPDRDHETVIRPERRGQPPATSQHLLARVGRDIQGDDPEIYQNERGRAWR
jgi:hypothetical protein